MIRDINNPKATRFELRAPNPFTNTYIVLSAIYMAILDGVKAAISSGKSTAELEAELSKEAGTPGFYLEKERAYRSEDDVFEDYTDEERDRLFGKPPATVWENMQNLSNYPEKLEVLKTGNIFRQELVDGFAAGALVRWKTEIVGRIIPENIDMIKGYKKLHGENASDLDLKRWEEIVARKNYLAKDSLGTKSLFTKIKEAVAEGDYAKVSEMQIEMAERMVYLASLYCHYKKNIID